MPGLADHIGIEAFLRSHEPLHEPTLYAAGDAVGVWRVEAFLGRGGSGEVYRVVHTQLGVAAAMKVLSRDDSSAMDRFRREARILAEHSIPAFPHFLGYGELGNHAYLVIELLEAMPLPNTDRDVARYLYKVCEGVAYLHGLGLVHRDIKPQNVLQRGATGQPVLIDLGLVKDTNLSPVQEGISLSIVDGQARGVGTPKYSAPEQFAGGKISPAADVHALGMLANECFGGNPPRSWERIIRRSTSSIPSQRYASVAEFVQAIKKRHRIKVLIFVFAPIVLLVLAMTIQLSWHYASLLRKLEAKMPQPRVGAILSDQSAEKKSLSKDVSTAALDIANSTKSALPDDQTKQGVVTNELSAVPDGDAKVYPHAGVFVGDHEINPDF